MSSLVSDFIINPVLRQARRFSSGFATDDDSAPTLQEHHRTRSAGEPSVLDTETAILESEGDRRVPGTRSGIALGLAEYTPPQPPQPAQPVYPVLAQPPDPLANIVSVESFSPPPRRTEQRTQRPQDAARSSPGQATPWTATGVATLPEDDGMGPLRRRILAVQATDIPPGLKAQLVHQLLMEGYTKAQPSAPFTPKLGSPTNTYVVSESTSEPAGPLQQALKFLSPLGSGPLSLPLSEEDRKPTYVPTTRPDDADDNFVFNLERTQTDDNDNGKPALGCEHYRRNVKLQCAACDKWYTCRFCHDAVENHTLPRKETKNMLCMLCGCPQKASDTCIGCGESASQYYCGLCKLWNDDPNKSIYHCNDCGLCRVGQGLGKDFFHCKKCMACISMAGGHKCIERSIDCDCPICGEYMFNSPRPVVFMQCGHSIHRHCFNEHMNSSYKCPICNKSCVNMEYQFRNYDIAILTQPMPAEYRDSRAIISCNDCSAKSQTAYHWLGLKCTVCNSYNTIQLQLLNMPGDATSAAAGAGRGALTPSGVNHEESQRNMALDAARILREIRRSQAAGEGGNSLAAIAAQEPLTAGSGVSDPSRLPHEALTTTSQSIPAGGILSLAATTNPPTITGSSSSHGPATSVARLTASEITHLNGVTGLTETPDDVSADEVDDDEDVLDFWGNDAGYLRRNFTSADEGDHDDNDDDNDDDDDDSSGDDCGVDTDEEEEDEEEDDDYANEIVLVGHR